MRRYEVKWSHEAIYDAADIIDYIELNFGYRRADRFEDEINEEVEKLGTDHSFYTDADGIYYRGYLIRKKPFSPSIIFFFVDRNTETVYVIRILRHETNWQQLLKETLFYTFE